MGNLKKQIIILYITILLCFACAIFSKIFGFDWPYDISVGAFTSSIVACFITLTQYNYEKAKAFKNIRREITDLLLKIACLKKFSNIKNIDSGIKLFARVFNFDSNLIEHTNDLDFISTSKSMRFHKQFSKNLIDFEINNLSNYQIHHLMLNKLIELDEKNEQPILEEYSRLMVINEKLKKDTIKYLSLSEYNDLLFIQKIEYHYNEIIEVLKNKSDYKELTLESILNRMSVVLNLFERKIYVRDKDIEAEIEDISRIARKWDDMSDVITEIAKKNVYDSVSLPNKKPNDPNNS